MPDVTKRILTDETGQDIVDALEALTNVVDPNGTTVAAAAKLNNMTTSITVLPAGSTPTSSLTEVNGHFHLTLGVPIELPTVSNTDNGKFLMVNNGSWNAINLDDVTEELGGSLISIEEKEKLNDIDKIDIYKTTESNPIVNITDGADNIPMVLTVGIDPVQDLNGYDNPWPEGGGKNLLNPTGVSGTDASVTYTKGTDGKWTSSGTASGTSTILVGEFDVKSGVSYTLNGCPSGGGTASYRIDVRTAPSSIYNDWIDTGSGMAFTPSEDAHLYVYIRAASGTNMAGKTFSPMIRLSSVTDVTFAPYSNICPISGWTGCNVSRTGTNIWDEEWEVGVYNQTTGEKATSTTQIRSKNHISVSPNTDYYLSMPNNVYCRKFFYNRNKEFISTTVNYGSAIVTVPNNCYYMTFQFGAEYGTTYNHDASINYPSTDTQYHLGQVEKIEYTFPSSAGTVYGGTLTINRDGTGKLVVDHATFDLGSTTWEYNSTNMFFHTIGIPAKSVSAELVPDWKCSQYKVISVRSTSNWGSADNFAISERTDGRVCVKDIRYTDAATFKTAMSGVQLVYELATPVTYELTDLEVIETLKGINNIWSDTGDTTITYVMETTGLIDTYDKIKIDTVPSKVSDLINDSGYISSVPLMTGATSAEDGEGGLVPAPVAGEEDKFLSGDGTYKSGGLPMVILSYGNSTWSDFINAYRNNVIVYCRASSNANPASGKQTRMAFMAYVNDSDNPTQVEFQYYRSMNPTNKSITQMSDQVFVYTLTSNGTWSVIAREASIKSVVCDASTGLSATYDKNTGALTLTAAT